MTFETQDIGKIRNSSEQAEDPLPPDWSNPALSSATAAIEALYREQEPALRRFVRRILRSNTDCDDIVQDAFVRTWRALAADRARSPNAVLFRTARNLALNHIRNRRLRSSDVVRNALNVVFTHATPSAEDHMIQSERAEGCRQLMDQLPARCREAFVLRVVDGLSYDGVSMEMGVSRSTAEKHVFKGKRLCQTKLIAAHGDGNSKLGAILFGAPQTTMERLGQDAKMKSLIAAESE
ncbi:MAG: RNA polymerase sigma factor [Rhizomicrobium sp.]